MSAAKKLQKKSTRHACRHTHSHLGVNVCDDVGVIIMSHVVAESESWPRLVIFDFSYCGDGAGVSCRGMSGGAGLVLTRTAHALMSPKNRSPELAMASAWVKWPSLAREWAAVFSALPQFEQKAPAAQKCPSALFSLAPR